MIDKSKIELMLNNAKSISAICGCGSGGWGATSTSTFIPKPRLKITAEGEEFEIIYVCARCGAKR